MNAASAMPSGIKVGVVGIDNTSVNTVIALLIAEHTVAVELPAECNQPTLRSQVSHQLDVCSFNNLLDNPVPWYLSKLIIGNEFSLLAHCGLVLACSAGTVEHKSKICAAIASVVPRTTVIASNLSVQNLNQTQLDLVGPERLLGVNLDGLGIDKSPVTIYPGKLTDQRYFQWLESLAQHWTNGCVYRRVG